MDLDLWVDFQRMQDDGRLLARSRNARRSLRRPTRSPASSP